MRCIFDVCVLMMLIYNVNCVSLDDHDHDDVSDFECFFLSNMMFV